MEHADGACGAGRGGAGGGTRGGCCCGWVLGVGGVLAASPVAVQLCRAAAAGGIEAAACASLWPRAAAWDVRAASRGGPAPGCETGRAEDC